MIRALAFLLGLWFFTVLPWQITCVLAFVYGCLVSHPYELFGWGLAVDALYGVPMAGSLFGQYTTTGIFALFFLVTELFKNYSTIFAPTRRL
ncbi:MAG: hypothetical protein V4674_02515 [Patescibacteria group bacterium]